MFVSNCARDLPKEACFVRVSFVFNYQIALSVKREVFVKFIAQSAQNQQRRKMNDEDDDERGEKMSSALILNSFGPGALSWDGKIGTAHEKKQ